MRKLFGVTGCLFFVFCSFSQSITQKLQMAYHQFEADSQLRHAISSLYVINAKTGKVVFDKNSEIGLAPASTQKIITAATAFELLGKTFRYKTEFGECYAPGGVSGGKRIWIDPSGDPTFGSWRWEATREKNILNAVVNRLAYLDLKNCKGFLMNKWGWMSEQIPDGWIWQDIGNYYGAGAGILNWRENQYDLFLRSGDYIGALVTVVETIPVLHSYQVHSYASSAKKGSGDNAYIYFQPQYNSAIVRGTIPINENQFKISGSMPDPANEFVATLGDSLKKRYNWSKQKEMLQVDGATDGFPSINYTHYSPSLDSIVYWFLQKSINLYGEALIKTMGHEKKRSGSTDSGVVVVKEFWKEKGIDEEELNIQDGSGLSPLNRVTTHAQVEILRYAKSKSWFPYFYEALPTYNGMKMKSGTIRDVKGYCGYHKAADGNEYIFSFLVNNYSGRSSQIVDKIYKVLDLLK